MQWLPPFEVAHEQFMKRMQEHERRMENYRRGKGWPNIVEEEFVFPADVATALNIYRHEEIERFRSGYPWKDPDWGDGKARKIADGLLDRKKQSAFYVDITKTGAIGLNPGLITRDEASEAIEQAKRLSEAPMTCSDEYAKLKQILPLIFSNLKGRESET
jgi:hypothetical protein